MSGITRDFSQQSVQELRDIIRKNLQDNQWGFFDWFDDTFLMQELNIKNYINNVNEYHAKMIDKHNMGSAEFDRILQRVHTVDENYSARINSLVDQAKALQTRIEQLTKMIDPSVITANPSDFARLADGIDSKYQKVKVQSETKIKQCEASMPVLYDKQWYENVVDSIEAGVNVAGKISEGAVCGTVDFAKGLVQGVVDTAKGIDNCYQKMLAFAKDPDKKFAEWGNYLEKHPFGFIQSYISFQKELPSFLSNQVHKSADDFAKADLKTKSEMVTQGIENLLLFLVPEAKIGTAGEAVELTGDLSKAGEAAGFAERLSQADEAAELLENLPKAGGIAEFAGDFSKAGKAVGLAGDLPKAGEVAEFAEDFNWGEATELAGNLSEADEAAELLKNLPKTDEAAEFAKDFPQASGSDSLINAEKALEEERAKIRIEKTAGFEEGVTQGESESEQAEIDIDEAKEEDETDNNSEDNNGDNNTDGGGDAKNSIIKIIKKNGLTVDEFNKLRLTNPNELSPEQVKTMKAIRDEIPKIDPNTYIQKTIPEGDIDGYMSGGWNQIGGYIAKYDDVSHIKNYNDVVESSRLDYVTADGNRPYPEGGNTYGYIKFKTKATDKISIPYGEIFGGSHTEGLPCTLNGFTGARNGEIVPEWILDNRVTPVNGSELHKVVNGRDTVIGIFNGKKFIGIGG